MVSANDSLTWSYLLLRFILQAYSHQASIIKRSTSLRSICLLAPNVQV